MRLGIFDTHSPPPGELSRSAQETWQARQLRHAMNKQTVDLLETIINVAFPATWVALAIVGFVASRRLTPKVKRRWLPRFAILVGVLFVFFATSLSVLSSRTLSSLNVLILVVPATILITYLNIKFTNVCEKCGALQYSYNWFDPMKFCSKCGAELPRNETAEEKKAVP